MLINYLFSPTCISCYSGMGGSHFAPIVMGETQAMEAFLLGKVFDAEEALRIGLVNRVFSMTSDDYDGEKKESHFITRKAIELAGDLAGKNPLAVRSMVRTMRMREDKIGMSLEVTLRREANAQALCFAKSDFGEGISAIMERRNPEFDGYHDP